MLERRDSRGDDDNREDVRTVRRHHGEQQSGRLDRGRHRSPGRSRRSPDRGHKSAGREKQRRRHRDDEEEEEEEEENNMDSIICSVINKSVHDRLVYPNRVGYFIRRT